jgi:hypothetical protein
VRDLLEGARGELLLRVADDAAERAIHPHEPPVEIDQGDPDRRHLERDAEPLLRAREGVDRASARVGVANHRHRELATFALERAEAHVDAQLAAVATNTAQRTTISHRARARRSDERGALPHVRRPLRAGHEHLDLLPDQLSRRIPEHLPRLLADLLDATIVVHDHEDVRSGLDQPPRELAFLDGPHAPE